MQVDFAPCEPFVGVASMYRDYEEDLLTTDCETWIPPSFIITKTALYCQTKMTPLSGSCGQIRCIHRVKIEESVIATMLRPPKGPTVEIDSFPYGK
jgi:hypothetical protein